MRTRQRSCAFYINWFFKVYQCHETGWWPVNTPNAKSIGRQDAFFWRALEIVAQTMNTMRLEDMKARSK